MTNIVNGVECEDVSFTQLQKENKEAGLDTIFLPDYKIALILLVVPEAKHIEIFAILGSNENGLFSRNINYAKLNIELTDLVRVLKEEIIVKYKKPQNIK